MIFEKKLLIHISQLNFFFSDLTVMKILIFKSKNDYLDDPIDVSMDRFKKTLQRRKLTELEQMSSDQGNQYQINGKAEAECIQLSFRAAKLCNLDLSQR